MLVEKKDKYQVCSYPGAEDVVGQEKDGKIERFSKVKRGNIFTVFTECAPDGITSSFIGAWRSLELREARLHQWSHAQRR